MNREKDEILKQLRSEGFRITKQRRVILDVILENHCASCKEIYYRAAKQDASVGMATVYRMVRLLEELGVLSREISYPSVLETENNSQ